MKKTLVYIDGYNLYYGLLKGLPSGKWLNPRETVSDHLKRAATYYAHIPRNLPAKCQLPDVISIGTHGRTIHRPAAWA